MSKATVYTIGHSTHDIDEFLAMLKKQHVTVLVDVRRLPGSNRYPQYNQDELQSALADAGIDYRWMQSLTGRRPVSRTVPFETNAWWQNRSFHNYADYALSEDFDQGLGELAELAKEQIPAVMCSEAVWWRCHRRIIADHLLARKFPVYHIMGPGEVKDAELSSAARIEGREPEVTYPATAAE